MTDPEYRHNADGTLDGLLTPASRVHVEKLNWQRWQLRIDLPDGGAVYVDLWAPRTRIRAYYREYGDQRVLEGGEFAGDVICHDKYPRVRRTPGTEKTPRIESKAVNRLRQDGA